MEMLDLTLVANGVHTENMTVEELLVKTGLHLHKLHTQQVDVLLNKILKVYDNPIQVKLEVTRMLSANSEDLRRRGLVNEKKLELVENPSLLLV